MAAPSEAQIRSTARALHRRTRHFCILDVDDLVQEAWLAHRTDPERGHYRAMVDAVRRAGLGTRRRPARHDWLGALDFDDEPPHPDEHGAVEDRLAFEADLGELPERERFVVEQRYWWGRTLADIGYDLGVTESMACRYHRQALARLRVLAA